MANMGVLTVKLQADTKGLAAISDAMLRVQRDILASVQRMETAITKMGSVSVNTSQKMASANKTAQESIRAEINKTAQAQANVSGPKLMGTSLPAISKKEVSNVVSEKQALAELAQRHQVSEGIIKEAIAQKNKEIALAQEKAKQMIASANKEADQMVAVYKKQAQKTNALIKAANKEADSLMQKRAATMIATANKEADSMLSAYKKQQAQIEAAQRRKTQQMISAANKEADAISKQQRKINADWDRAISENEKRNKKFNDDWNKAIERNNKLNKIDIETKSATAKLDQFATNMATISQRIRTFGYLASAAITAPIVLAGKAAFNLAKEYEYSMQKIVGLTGVAQSVVGEWNKQLLQLSTTLGKSPQELADALYFISSSGIKGAEAMKVLELSAKAATAGLGDTKSVADLLTSALNAYSGTGLTAQVTTDTLVAAVREGKAEASGFASAMGQIVPIASQMGVSFDQVAGGMAAITLTGSTAASAATYLKGVFNSLMKESQQGSDALKSMGTSYEELRKILANQGLVALMQKLRDLQMANPNGDAWISDVLPNIRALSGFLSIAGKNFEYNKDMMDRVTNSAGSLNTAYLAVSETIKVRFDRSIASAQVSLISLGQSVGQAFLPILDSLVKKLDSVTKWFNGLTEAQQRHKLVAVALIAALGPLSLLLSVIGYTLSGLTTIVSKAIKTYQFLSAAVRGLAGSYEAANIAAAKNLISGAMIAGYVALAAAMVALTVVIVKLVREHNELKRVQNEIAGQTAQETSIMAGIFERAKMSAEGTKERANAIATINEKYGKYLKNLLTETSSVTELADAYDSVSKTMQNYMQVKSYSDVLQKHVDKTTATFSKSLGDISNMLATQRPDMLSSFYTDIYAAANKAIEKGNGEVNEAVRNVETKKIYDKYYKS